MDKSFKNFHKFRLVKHRRIKLKKQTNILLQSLRLTSCLNNCDNYYFSPSKVSLVSSLPEFQFKTRFNYNTEQNKIRLEPIKKKKKQMQKNDDKKPRKQDITTHPKKNDLFDRLMLLNKTKETTFNGNENHFESDTEIVDQSLVDKNSVNSSDNINQLINASDEHMSEHSRQDISNDFFTPVQSPINLLRSRTKTPENSMNVKRLSDIENKLERMNETLAQMEKTLRDISKRTVRFSTPVNQSTRHPVFDPNISSIRADKQINRTIGTQMLNLNASKCDKTTQTVEKFHKSIQTNRTFSRDQYTQSSSSIRTNGQSISTQTSVPESTDTDPECPFPPSFRYLIRQSFNF